MELSVQIERWPLASAFTISRGTKTEAVVVVAELTDGTHRGRGESVPYARYGETPDGIVAAIEAMRPALRRGLDRAALQSAMPPGAARNALDCAYWDVNAKLAGRRVHELAGLGVPVPLTTAYTISLGPPAAMAEAAERAASRALLKVKLGGGEDDGKRIAAVRRAAPTAELIVDANEGWSADSLAANLAACADAGVTLIEQPLPEGPRRRARPHQAADSGLRRRKRACSRIARCADRQIRRRQHQARQGRWPDGSAGARHGCRAARSRLLWSGAWSLHRCRWRRLCWSPSARVWSILMVRCCSRRIVPRVCATKVALLYPPDAALWG